MVEYLKPSFDEWMYWTQVIIERLTTIARVYAKPPYPDVFMLIREKQSKSAMIADMMGRFHQLTDEAEFHMPQDPSGANDYLQTVIGDLERLCQELLSKLPSISEDMQSLLKSHWFDNCAGKVANSIFRGTTSPSEDPIHGIGSGVPENNRLPSKIADLLDRESVGMDRAPRLERPRYAPNSMRRDELAQLWAERNGTRTRTR